MMRQRFKPPSRRPPLGARSTSRAPIIFIGCSRPPRSTRCFAWWGGWRLQAGGLTGSIIRQEGGLTNDAFFIDATAGELDGLLIENIALGTTSNGRHALHLGANVNRSVFRNIFLAGAVESAFKQATPGNHILNHYENIRISMGFVSVLGYAIPKRGFDLGAGSTSVFLKIGR